MRTLMVALMLMMGLLHAEAGPCAPTGAEAGSLDEIRALIGRKIDFYNREFPQIRFVHLEGGADWHGDMVALLMLLGLDADNLDYEHPPRPAGRSAQGEHGADQAVAAA